MKKRVFKLLLIIFGILLLNSNSVLAKDIETGEYSKKYQEWLQLSDEEKSNTIAPFPTNIRGNKVDNNIIGKFKGVLKSMSIPSSYDLRDHIDVEVKDQKNTGECWAFSANTSLETELELNNETYDFSERHIDYDTSNSFTDGTNSYALNRKVGSGGFSSTAFTYYSRGSGPILEEDMPFENSETSIALFELPKEVAVKKVDNMIYFPNVYKKYDENNNLIYIDANEVEYSSNEMIEIRKQIKEHIMNYGGITVAIYAPDDTDYYNEWTHAAYVNNTDLIANHAVTIIGWDDEYSKTNFNIQPKEDGAYIVLNSWGTEWGDNGIYYVSYEDFLIESQMRCVEGITNINYDNLYQHDISEMWNVLEYKYAANVFTSQNNEKMTEVMIGSLSEQECNVYVNTENDNLNIANLTPIASNVKLKPGYNTVKLNNPLQINKGNKFAIIIEITSENEDEDEIGIGIEDNNDVYFGNATSNEGESFVSENGIDWQDIYDENNMMNLSIKAYTQTDEKNFNVSDISGRGYANIGGKFSFSIETSYTYSKNKVGINIFNNLEENVTERFEINGDEIRGNGAFIKIECPNDIEEGQYEVVINVPNSEETISRTFQIGANNGEYITAQFNDEIFWSYVKSEFVDAITDSKNLTISAKKIEFDEVRNITKTWGKEITDITGIEYLTNLESINLNSNKITDLTPLSKLQHLNVLDIDLNDCVDFSPLSNLSSLKRLHIGGNNMSNGLSFLQNLNNLEDLSLDGCEIPNEIDISYIFNLKKLESLNLTLWKWVTEDHLQRVSDLSNLKRLELSSCNIGNIDFVKGLNLEDLSIGNATLPEGTNHISDLSPIQNMTTLSELSISRLPEIETLNDLANLSNLESLWCQTGKLRDATALDGDNFKDKTFWSNLCLSNNRINDEIVRTDENMIIEVPKIIQQACDENSLLYSSSGINLGNCEWMEYGKTIKVNSNINYCSIVINSGYAEGTVYSVNITEQQRLLDHIEISNNPDKTTYYIGEEFNSEGIEITATYNDGTTADVTADTTFSGFDSTTTGTKTITATFGDKTATFEITVNTTNVVGTWDISASVDDNVTATLYKDGKLEISGTGNMKNWLYNNTAEWYAQKNIITSVIINSGVTNIGAYAFYECSSLASIEIPDSVTSIGSSAFHECSGLTSIAIPNSVTSILWKPFEGCSSLTSISVDSNNTNYSSDVNRVLYDKNKTKLICCPAGTELTTITIPETVTSIEDFSFLGCSSLTSIEISDIVTSIGTMAFKGCGSLKDVTILNNEIIISNNAFNECSNQLIIYSFEGGNAIEYATNNNINAKYLYNIEFDKNAGNDEISNMPESQIKKQDLELTLSGNIPQRTGYTFNGWSTSDKATTAEYQPGEAYTKNKDTTLYAVWQAKKFTLTIDPAGGEMLLPKTSNSEAQTTTEAYNNLEFAYGTQRLFMKTAYRATTADKSQAWLGTYMGKAINGDNLMIKDGYKFKEWKIISGKGQIIDEPVDDGENGTIHDYYFDGNYEGDVVIQAQWEALPTITVDPNGTEMIITGKEKTSSPQTITFYPGNTEKRTFASVGSFSINGYSQDRWFGFTKVNDLKVPYRNGYTFAGWQITEGQGQISEDTDSEGNWIYYYDCSYSGNVTIQAQWTSNEVIKYTVSYNANGGTGAPAAQQKNENEALTLSTVEPTREGYTFQGWATNSEATEVEYQAGDEYTNNYEVTLFAVWEPYQIVDNKLIISGDITKENAENYPWYSNKDNIAEIEIHEGVTAIGPKAFYGYSNVEKVTIADSVTDIANEAFYGCSSLKEITIPSGVKTIRVSAFANCTSLENVIIPETVEKIYGTVFASCSNLKNVAFLGDTLLVSAIFNNQNEDLTIYCLKDTKPHTQYKNGTIKCNTEKWSKSEDSKVVAGINKDGNLYVFGTGSIATESLPTPTVEEGNEFKGWSETENGEVISTTEVGAGKTLYAKVSETPKYKLTEIDQDGDKFETEYEAGTKVTLQYCSGGGYTLVWYTDEACTTEVELDENNQYTTKAEDVTIYGKRIATTVKVTFMKNDGTEEKAEQTFTYGEKEQKFSEKGWTKEGYTLVGWASKADSTEIVNTKNENVNNQWIIEKAPELTLYAVWAERKVASIKVTSPSKTVYVKGTELDLSGTKVTVTYDNGETSEISLTTEMLSGYDKTTVGEQTITVTYEGQTATFEITVAELEITITNDNYQSLEINNTKYIVADKGTTAEALLGNMKLNSADYNLVIKNSNSEIVADSDKLKTNQTIELDESNQNFNAVVVIKGDVNSDGTVDLKDIVKLNNYRISKAKTENTWSVAEKVAFKSIKSTEITDTEIEKISFRDIASLNNYRISK